MVRDFKESIDGPLEAEVLSTKEFLEDIEKSLANLFPKHIGDRQSSDDFLGQ